MKETTQCSETFWSYSGSRFGNTVRCSNRAKPGTDKCGIHSPEAKAKREAKSNALYQAQTKAWQDKRNRAEAGEMGIELAKWILKEPASFEFYPLAQAQAKAILDKLEGK